MIVFPLLGLQMARTLNLSKRVIMSFYQKDPIGFLACGGV
jgi:hypothetical protein